MEFHSSLSRSKVDWENLLINRRLDSISDTQGMDGIALNKAVESWTRTGEKVGVFTPSALYRILCDFAHPNFGSTLLSLSFSTNSAKAGTISEPSTGLRLFAMLYPSLAALAMKLQEFLNTLQDIKFGDE